MNSEKVEERAAAIRWHISKKRKFLQKQESRADLDENKKIFIGEEYAFIRSVEDMLEDLKRFYDANMGKMPPQDPELEKTVLGAIISHPGALEEVKDLLKPEHFCFEAHKIAYRLVLKSPMSPPGVRQIVQQARKDGVLEEAGGVAYLIEMDSIAVQPLMVKRDALVVMEYAMRRKMLEVAADIMVDGYDETVDVFELKKKFQKSIEEIEAWCKPKK